MRQAVEPSWKESLDAIEEIVAILLADSGDEQSILTQAVATLAGELDYAGAFIVTKEEGQDAYALRAYALRVDEEAAATLEPVLQAVLEGERRLTPVETATDVFGLLYPLLDAQEASRWQDVAGVRGVYVQPLTLPVGLSGSLLIMSGRSRFADMELRVLQMAAQQLALGVRTAHLYRRLEQQQRAAQTFAHMAFSGSAYVHTLRNQIGSLQPYLGLVRVLPHLKPAQRDEVVANSHMALERLDQAAEILDHLHEPWRRQPDVDTDVNDCLTAALLKVFGGLPVERARQASVSAGGVQIEWRLGPDLPALRTSREMLTEAFRVVIRNAADALNERYGTGNEDDGLLQIESALSGEGVVVTITDNGPGIAPEHARHIFDMGWSTKKGMGMGFGLFWVRNFVEGLGGDIQVESAPENGAVFRFSLPVTQAYRK